MCSHCHNAAAKTVCHTCSALIGKDSPSAELMRPLCNECFTVVHSVDSQVLDIEGDDDLELGDDEVRGTRAIAPCRETTRRPLVFRARMGRR